MSFQKIVKKIRKGLRLLLVNPRLFFVYLKKYFLQTVVYPFWQPPPRFRKKIGKIIFDADFRSYENYQSVQGATNEIYFGVYEPEVLCYVKKALRPGDVFLDIGASVGYISAIAMSRVGQRGAVHCFDPLPLHQPALRMVLNSNPGYHVEINDCAVGDAEGILKFNYPGFPNYGGSSLVNGFLESLNIPVKEKLDVKVMRLDNYIKQKSIGRISLIKIDVEGYEYPVLKGLSGYFESTPYRPDIVCEIQPSAYPLLGYSMEDLARYMAKYNYRVYDLFNPKVLFDFAGIKTKEGLNVVWRAD